MVKLFGFEFGRSKTAIIPATTSPTLSLEQASQLTSALGIRHGVNSAWTGEKFPGGLGATQLLELDYWELRAASAELFHRNLYARGLIRRLVTNEINTGISIEAIPDTTILGLPEESLSDWAEDIERKFDVWGKNPLICDYKQESTFAQIQKIIRRESLIEGDILVVLRQNDKTKMTSIQLINGSKVTDPLSTHTRINTQNIIRHGVEIDKNGRKIAFWIKNDKGIHERIAAFSSNGRRLSWLVYGCDKRMDEVRGEPILSIILQSLKEIDRYRDSVQRKAVINSILAMFIQKKEAMPGTLPLTGGAVRHDTIETTDADGDTKTLAIEGQIPGLILQELQKGEEPKAFGSDGTDLSFPPFEAAMLRAIAWACEIPPEILILSFTNNYSASQAAINEFKLYLNPVRTEFASGLNQYVYIDWLISETLLRKIPAPGFLESWRNPLEYEKFGAWTLSDWSGAIKISSDPVKQAKACAELLKLGLITRRRAARETNGTKFSQNMKEQKKENEEWVIANTPLAEFKQKYGAIADDLLGDNNLSAQDLVDQLNEAKE